MAMETDVDTDACPDNYAGYADAYDQSYASAYTVTYTDPDITAGFSPKF
jgi:hypothetical protein